jgi:glycosyltransferase
VKISIITVVYNNKADIKHAVESVLSQTWPDIEYIVIDGGSTDGTVDELKLFAAKIHTLISEKDNGMYDALNKGIRLATGDVIGILHSDDIFKYRM